MCTNYYSPERVKCILQEQGVLKWIKTPTGYYPFKLDSFEMEIFKLNDSQNEFYFRFPYIEGQDYNMTMNFMHQAIQVLNKELDKYDMEKLCYKPEPIHTMK